MQANSSVSIITTLEPKFAYSVWSPTTKTWEASWTATWCEATGFHKELNIIVGCHSVNSGSKCLSDVTFTLTVTECTSFYEIQYLRHAAHISFFFFSSLDNASLPLWNPDTGALRWLVTLGGIGSSVVREPMFTFLVWHSRAVLIVDV